MPCGLVSALFGILVAGSVYLVARQNVTLGAAPLARTQHEQGQAAAPVHVRVELREPGSQQSTERALAEQEPVKEATAADSLETLASAPAAERQAAPHGAL